MPVSVLVWGDGGCSEDDEIRMGGDRWIAQP